MSRINNYLKDQEARNREASINAKHQHIAKIMSSSQKSSMSKHPPLFKMGLLVTFLFPLILLVINFNTVQTLINSQLANQTDVSTESERTGVMEKIETPPSVEEQANLDYEDAIAALQNDESITAKTLLQGILQSVPEFEPARESLAIIWLSEGDSKKAVGVLEQGLNYNPEHLPFSKLLAEYYISEQDYAKALTYLLRSQPNITDDSAFYGTLAGVYRKLGEPGQAASIYNQLLQIEPDEGTWWMGLAISFQEADKPEAAMVAYEKALNTGRLTAELAQFSREQINVLHNAKNSKGSKRRARQLS